MSRILLLFLFAMATMAGTSSADTPPASKEAQAHAAEAPEAHAAEAPEAHAAEATPEAHVAALEEMCAASSEARAARHAKSPLFERLGKEEKIHALTEEVVRLHLQNPAIKHLVEGVDTEVLADRVAKFLITGTGGPAVYEGPTLVESHRDMKLTNAHFVAAGSDIVQAMKNLEYGQDEIDEVVCSLVALREQVVLTGQPEKKEAE